MVGAGRRAQRRLLGVGEETAATSGCGDRGWVEGCRLALEMGRAQANEKQSGEGDLGSGRAGVQSL